MWGLFIEWVVPWFSREGSVLGACIGGNRHLKLGTAGRWEVEGVPFW